jgi:hypothetical protein
VEIIVLPYLPLREPVVIGGWRLIPAQRTDSESFVNNDIGAQARGCCFFTVPAKVPG